MQALSFGSYTGLNWKANRGSETQYNMPLPDK
jgi:hypothetical protein